MTDAIITGAYRLLSLNLQPAGFAAAPLWPTSCSLHASVTCKLILAATGLLRLSLTVAVYY